MRTKIVIGLLTVAAILGWTGVVGAQTAPPTPKVQLPSGDTVWDLSGDWDTFHENFGEKVRFGNYPNAFRITQTGSEFKAIRLRDNPPPSVARAGSLSLQGEVDTNGFKRVDIVTGQGIISPSKGQIAADGKKIVIDNGATIRVTLTRK